MYTSNMYLCLVNNFKLMFRKIITFTFLLVVAASCSKTTVAPDYSAADKTTIEAYLLANNLTAQSTASGVYYIITEPGGAYHPGSSSGVKAKYKGYLTDGTVFDQSAWGQYANPATFRLTGVIEGWQEGMQLIGVNGKIKLLIPSALGYGTSAQTDLAGNITVPANSVLIFDIELLDIYQ